MLTPTHILSFLVPLLALSGLFSYRYFGFHFGCDSTKFNDVRAVDDARSPYAASWGSWWQNRGAGRVEQGMRGQKGGGIGREWNVLEHLGGNGPWIEKRDGVVGEGTGIGPPEGCVVDMVHMMSRHAERYPTIKAGSRMLDMLSRVKATNITLQGDLAFLNTWQFFTPNPQAHFEQLTTTGPYAGTLSAFTTGVRLRTRYAHLLPHRLSHNRKTSLWAGDSARVIDTARYFAAGFFGLDWASTATLHVIPETAERGANTLTPGDSCVAYIEDETFGHDYGARMLMAYRATYLAKIRERLRLQNPGIVFSDAEIYSMQEMCGFETTVRGASPWCDVFSRDEWRDFEYARDVIHYYRAGPGNRWAGVMGSLWLKRTAELLEEGPEAGPLFFSFVHDGDIIPMLAFLDLFPQPADLPITRRDDDRAWKTSQVTPMGGRAVFERLSCRPIQHSNGSQTPQADENEEEQPQTFIRININDGIVALPGCSNGPGRSCPLSSFSARIRERGAEVGDFGRECGVRGEGDGEEGVRFLVQ